MNIQFQLDLSDILDMQEDVIQSSYSHEIKRKYFKWICSIIILVAGLLLMKVSFVFLIISVVVAGIFFLLAPKLYQLLTSPTLKRQIQQQDHAKLLKSCTMQISEAGINRELEGEHALFPWDEFTRFSEDSSHYFLYVSDLEGIIIPKEPDEIEKADSSEFQATFMKVVKRFIVDK